MSSARFYNHSSARNTHVACSRRSNSRAREKNSRRIKKEGRLEGERGKGEGTFLALAPPSPPRFPGVQFNSLPTDRRALLSERLEQVTTHKGNHTLHFIIITRSGNRQLDRLVQKPLRRSWISWIPCYQIITTDCKLLITKASFSKKYKVSFRKTGTM